MKTYKNKLLPKIEADNDGYVWYYSYGSNINSKILQDVRQIIPKKSVVAKILDYQLNFELAGIPVREPCYGGIQEMKGSEVHGVAHLIKLEDFWQLQLTELGGGVTNNMGYYYILLDCETYDGQHIPVWTLKVHENAIFKKYHLLPSKRYINIIQEGAKSCGLDQNYQDYLQTLEYTKNNWFTEAFYYLFYVFIWLVYKQFQIRKHKQFVGPKLIYLMETLIVYPTIKSLRILIDIVPEKWANPNFIDNPQLKLYSPKKTYQTNL